MFSKNFKILDYEVSREQTEGTFVPVWDMASVTGSQGADDISQRGQAEVDAGSFLQAIAGCAGSGLPFGAGEVDQMQPASPDGVAVFVVVIDGDRLQRQCQHCMATRARRVHLRRGRGSPLVALLHQRGALGSILHRDLAQATSDVGASRRVLLQCQTLTGVVLQQVAQPFVVDLEVAHQR